MVFLAAMGVGGAGDLGFGWWVWVLGYFVVCCAVINQY